LVSSTLLGALAALALAAPVASEPSVKFEKYTLPNGLTVILSEDHRLPQVAVDIWYHVGAANQLPGKSGFAHLFEHMMFSGAKHIGPQPFKILEGIGTQAGAMANGTTSFDRTNYFETVPASELPTALWLESDRMAFLLDTLDEKKLSVQRDVVSNERRQSYENRPYGTAQLRVCDELFPAPHPYFNCVIGTVAEIQSASKQDLEAFFRTFYAPNNASLAIVGDFKPEEVKPLVEKYFGPIPRGPEIKRPELPSPSFSKPVEAKLEDKNIDAPRLSLVWHGVKSYSADEPAGDVLQFILGVGKTSRLYRRLVFEKQVAAEVDAGDEALGLGGYFEINATANQGHTVTELKPMVQAVIDDVKQNGVKPEEVERAKRNIIAGLVRGLEKIGGFGGKADLLNQYQTYVGDPGYLTQDLARYRAVTTEQVQAFAKKYLLDDQRLVLDVEPAAHAPAAK
jgi:zinc protease